MRGTQPAHLISRLLPLLAFPARAGAQTAGVGPAGTTESPSASGGSVAILAVVLVMLLAIGVAIKLFDRKRKREDEAVSLQSQISDALVLDPSLVGLPITAFAVGSFWRRSPFILAITGTVPTPELRDAVMRAAGRPGVVPSSARRAGRGSARGRSADAKGGPNFFDRPTLMAKAVLSQRGRLGRADSHLSRRP